MGKVGFSPPCDFKELGVAKRSRSTTSARSALRQPWSIIARTNIFEGRNKPQCCPTETVSSFSSMMISASPIAGCPSFKFLTMQMQPSASCARKWTVLSATIMFADKPHRLNERTSAQRFCVLTILPPVTALAVGLPAQRAIAQRFRALALFARDRRVGECLLLREERKSGLRGPISVFDPGRVKTFSIFQKLHTAGRDPRRRDHLSIFLLYRAWSQSGRNLGPRSAAWTVTRRAQQYTLLTP